MSSSREVVQSALVQVFPSDHVIPGAVSFQTPCRSEGPPLGEKSMVMVVFEVPMAGTLQSSAGVLLLLSFPRHWPCT